MPTYIPNGTVTIDSVDFTSQSINSVSIYYGRTNIWDQARAGYARIEILVTNNANNGFEINDSVVITVDNSSGNPQTVFTGRLTDVSNSMSAVGASGEAAIQTITAIGPFADMARRVVGLTPYPAEYDDVRLLAILTETGVTIDVVDTPGNYKFAARAAGADDGYTLAAYFAQMAFGYIYETTAGAVGYANEAHRNTYVNTYGYTNIPESYILWRGITSNRTLNDILNSIVLSYDAGNVTSSDAASIASYGEIAATVATELDLLAEAQVQADRYVTLRANPQTSLSSFNIALASSAVSDADRDLLIGIEMGLPIQITGLPIPISPVTYKGFVEGWNLSFSRTELFLAVSTSDATFSLTPTRWQDVSASLIWSAVDPTLTWANYDG
jgi:hypothetical protein